MKQRKANIIRRFAGLVFGLITVLGFFFIVITYITITHYHNASTQLINKDVASHIAKFSSPFEGSGIEQKLADSVFYDAMVLNPAAEIYFLDTTGKIIAYHHDEIRIRKEMISLVPIKKYLTHNGEKYVTATDPRDPADDKIFSAAKVSKAGATEGYIYVILNSKKSEGIMDMLFGNHILNLSIASFIVIILLSLIFSLLYLRQISRNYRKFIAVLERFEAGDYSARFHFKKHNELEPVSQAFNRMADLLASSIKRLTVSEKERRNFIATISHDLRTPLAIARGYAETMVMKKGQAVAEHEDHEHYSELICTKLLQIENMVNELFELSKMEAVEFKPAMEPFVLSEILQEAVHTFQLIAAKKNVTLKCTECIYHVWINADVSMMERVVQNLIANALNNTPSEGKVDVWLEVAGKDLVFKIENSGEPVPPVLEQWINSSSEGLASFSNRPAGAGLGLIIVQRILSLHGSSLKVSRGAAGVNLFSFHLPEYIQPKE